MTHKTDVGTYTEQVYHRSGSLHEVHVSLQDVMISGHKI